MNSNKDLYVKIISIASLVVLGYIFFISVYNQIIVQSGGVFYIIIFGGILILAFVLLSLVTKLIEITGEIRDNIMWSFVEILLLCHLSYLFLVFRMAYKSTVPGEETVLYRAAALMREGALADKGMDMIQHLCIYPSQYLYAFILSVFFRIGGVKSSILIVLNAVIIILTAFLIDRVVRKIAGRACGIIAAMCTVFIPSQAFAVYSYSSEPLFCALLLLCIDLWLMILDTDDGNRKKQLVLSVLFGLSAALLCFVEPLMILSTVVYIVYYFIKQKKSGRNPAMMTAAATAAFVIALLIFTFAKSNSLGVGFGEVISGGLSRYKLSVNIETSEKYTAGEIFKKFHENLDNQNTNVKDNYHFLVNEEGASYTQTHNAWFSLGTQMSYMFALVMSIACAFYMFRNNHKSAIPVFVTLIVSFLALFFRSTDEASTFFLFELLIISACCGLNYMYMNHHPELFALASGTVLTPEKKEESETAAGQAMEWGAVARAKNLIFIKNDNDIPAEAMSGQEGGAPVQNIPDTNALPAPEPVSVPVPEPVPAPVREADTMMGGSVSPEGYFSFFDLPPVSAPVNRTPEPAPEPVEEYTEDSGEYTGQFEEYAEPVEEYIEPVEEYSGPVEEYMEPDGYSDSYGEYPQDEEYEEVIEDYNEDDTGYTQGADYSASVDYDEPEYGEPGYEEAEYKLPSYTEPAFEKAEYEEPAYEETVEEVAENEAPDSAEPVYEDEGYESGYDEPSFDDLVAEYGHEPVPDAPVSPGRTTGGTTKASFTSAAHALGFSLSDDFFTNVGQSEEPVYAEPAYEEPAYEEPVYEEPAYEEPVYEEPEYGEQQDYEEPAYDPSYDSGVDEFSFGEGMPDISMFEESASEPEPEPAYEEPVYEEPVYEEPPYQEPVYEEPAAYSEPEPVPEPLPVPAPAPAPKKKVVKKKVVRRVVKKVSQKPLPTMDFKDDLSVIREQFEPREDLPTMQFKTDLSSIEEAFSYEEDYVDDAEIYDEPAGGEGPQGFTIEI